MSNHKTVKRNSFRDAAPLALKLLSKLLNVLRLQRLQNRKSHTNLPIVIVTNSRQSPACMLKLSLGYTLLGVFLVQGHRQHEIVRIDLVLGDEARNKASTA